MKVNWKEEYERVLKDICEAERPYDEPIVDVMDENLMGKMIPNENASFGSRFCLKLPEGSSDEDYKAFCYYVYERSGEDFDDYLKEAGKVFY